MHDFYPILLFSYNIIYEGKFSIENLYLAKIFVDTKISFILALKKSHVDNPFTGNIYHLRGKIRLEGELSIFYFSFLFHQQ